VPLLVWRGTLVCRLMRVILHSALRPSAVRSRFGARSNGRFSARPCHPMHRGEGPLTTPSRSPLISDRFVAPRHRRRHPAARHGSIIGGLLALLILHALIRALAGVKDSETKRAQSLIVIFCLNTLIVALMDCVTPVLPVLVDTVMHTRFALFFAPQSAGGVACGLSQRMILL